MAEFNGQGFQVLGRTFGEVAKESALALASMPKGERYGEIALTEGEYFAMVNRASQILGGDPGEVAVLDLLMSALKNAAKEKGVQVQVSVGSPKKYSYLGGMSFCFKELRSRVKAAGAKKADTATVGR